MSEFAGELVGLIQNLAKDAGETTESAADEISPQWSQVQELGLVGIGIPEDLGGSGGELGDLVVVVRELAAHAIRTPIVGPLSRRSPPVCRSRGPSVRWWSIARWPRRGPSRPTCTGCRSRPTPASLSSSVTWAWQSCRSRPRGRRRTRHRYRRRPGRERAPPARRRSPGAPGLRTRGCGRPSGAATFGSSARKRFARIRVDTPVRPGA